MATRVSRRQGLLDVPVWVPGTAQHEAGHALWLRDDIPIHLCEEGYSSLIHVERGARQSRSLPAHRAIKFRVAFLAYPSG